MARKERLPDWKVVYRKKYGRKRYAFISEGREGRDAFANFEKVFPGITKGLIYVSASKTQ